MATKKKTRIRVGEHPIVCKDGHALLLMGLVADQMCACVHILPATIERMGLQPGDYVQIENNERDTQIVRQIARCPGCMGMRHDYAYLDRESARYLEGDIHDCLRVRPASIRWSALKI